jgi:hypothetical protein
MGSKFEIQVMVRVNSQPDVLSQEARLLHAKIGGLQELIAELLLKNQQLREALGDRTPNNS